MTPGTHSQMATPASEKTYSHATWGWPVSARRQPGRNSPTRFDHNAAPPAGSTTGGASTVI